MAVITGGQPGSGKGGITAQAQKEMAKQGGYVLVDPDLLRPEHPKHRALMRANDREAADFTHSDASKWAKQLTTDAIEGRRNLIIDQTSKSPDSLVALTTRLKEAGYCVELRVIAVKDEISAQRIHTRYEDEKEQKGSGRFVPNKVHDAAYKGLPESVDAVERAKTVDRLAVHDKHQKSIYENTVRDGEWVTRPPGAKLALESERARPLSVEDQRKKAAAYARLCEQLEKRGAKPSEREAMEAERAAAARQLAAHTSRQSQAADALKPHAERTGAVADTSATKEKAREAAPKQAVRGVPQADATQEQAQGQGKPGQLPVDPLAKQRAQAFASKPQAEALKDHPELAGSYAAMHSMKQSAQSPNLTVQQQNIVSERIKQNVVNSLERGELPQVKVREQVEVKREVDKDRTLTG